MFLLANFSLLAGFFSIGATIRIGREIICLWYGMQDFFKPKSAIKTQQKILRSAQKCRKVSKRRDIGAGAGVWSTKMKGSLTMGNIKVRYFRLPGTPKGRGTFVLKFLRITV